jgi:hypothetical protein
MAKTQKSDLSEDRTELRLNVLLSTAEAVRALSETRSKTLSESVDHFVKVGGSRIRALKNHNLVLKKARKAEVKKVQERKAKRKAKATTQKAEPAAEATE